MKVIETDKYSDLTNPILSLPLPRRPWALTRHNETIDWRQAPVFWCSLFIIKCICISYNVPGQTNHTPCACMCGVCLCGRGLKLPLRAACI